MRHLSLRIIVALLTFALGLGASAVPSLFRSAPAQTTLVQSPSRQFVAEMRTSTATATATATATSDETQACSCTTGSEAFSADTSSRREIPIPAPAIVSGGVLNGKAISKPAPVYPSIAEAAHVTGTVVVHVVVDPSGKVLEAKAISGHPLLQSAAAMAACQARFTPTLLSGKPVRVSGVLTYNFRLE